jgi:hypothetical protein
MLTMCSRAARATPRGANALRQPFHLTADGWKSSFITDEKPPIEVVRDHERASGATDRCGVSDPNVRRPTDRRTGGMQRVVPDAVNSVFHISPSARVE